MVAVGGGGRTRPPTSVAPAHYVSAMMACGAALGLMGYPFPMVEVGIACSAIALGLMVLLEAQPPQMVSLALVAFFALFHGHAHGTELPAGQNGLLYSFGSGSPPACCTPWESARDHAPLASRVILRTAGAGAGGGLFFLGRSIGWLS